MQPYAIFSDVHAHAWSAFSTRNKDGVNSRLAIICSELKRGAEELRKAGGEDIYIAGDLFHTRGAIDPEVFNPLHETIREILADGNLYIYAIPGNHDLKGRESVALSNAMQTLGALENFKVVIKPEPVSPTTFMIPWCETKTRLLEAIATLESVYKLDPAKKAACDLIMHAGIDGVLSGMPAHGLPPSEVESWGFKRVFAGHYHNHVIFPGEKVISIGATTHQTWSDVGTKAGFLIVHDDRIDFRAAWAPSFVEVTDTTDPDDLPLIVDGNYVRVRGVKATDEEINKMRDDFLALGAKGFVYQGVREVVTARGAASPTASGMTLEASVANFVADKKFDKPFEDAVLSSVSDILSTVNAVSA